VAPLTLAKDIPAVMRELGIAGNVGIAGRVEMPADVFDVVSAAAKPVAAESLVEEIAIQRTPEELDVVREVARIADLGVNALINSARVGIREIELVADASYAMRQAGSEDVFILLSSERHNQALHAPTDKRLTRGDILIAEMAPFINGQCTQVCRTIVIGTPSEEVVKKYKLLVYAFEESLKTIKPGLPASCLAITMNKIISEAGPYEKYCYPPYMRARGHGFGAGSIAPGPTIDYETKVILQSGMVLISHPNQYLLPETGYLACGETVLVTETGIERLFKNETRLYVKEG